MLTYKRERDFFDWAQHTNVECVRHIHPHLEIIAVTDGTLKMRVSGVEYSINTGQGIFVSAFEPHEFHSETGNECTVLMFSDELVSGLAEFLETNKVTSHIFAVSEQSLGLLQRILSEEKQSVSYFEAQAVLAPLCLEMLTECSFSSGRRVLAEPVERAFDYIKQHLPEDLSLESVAREVGLHPVSLSKSFSRKTGVSFNFCVKYQRCVQAAMMIRVGGSTFTEIAMACGFGSVRSFNRGFREIHGITPSEYRDKKIAL